MSSIGEYILDLRNKYGSKTKEIQRKVIPFEEAAHIGLLFYLNEAENPKILNDFVKQLKKEGKKISCFTYFEKEVNQIYSFDFEYFTKKNIQTLGNIQSEGFKHFTNTSFDYLFFVSSSLLPVFEKLLKKSKAKCRVGKHFENKENCFDLMIESKDSDSLNDLSEQMLFYTKALVKSI